MPPENTPADAGTSGDLPTSTRTPSESTYADSGVVMALQYAGEHPFDEAAQERARLAVQAADARVRASREVS